VPLFFFNYISSENIFYIVDGQQRLEAITKFYNNELGLNKKFSGEENHGKKFSEGNAISEEQREKFLDYELNYKVIEDYNDERVRLIFSRLQRGKPLSLGERLNAFPGDIVLRMREIARHPFMKKSINIAQHRYGAFPDAARILFYEKLGCRDSGTPAILKFFDTYKNIGENDEDYRRALSALNFLLRCFPEEPGNYYFFSKHAWVFSVYSMIRELSVAYALNGQKNNIRNFIEEFHNKIYSEELRTANQNYQRFYDNVRGGWSERIIRLRRTILIEEFLKRFPVAEFGTRQINDEDKIAVFERQGRKCLSCSHQVGSFRDLEYHHKELYSQGGQTNLENIIGLCTDCHKKVHGKEKIELPTEDEVMDTENNEE
jgi:hypothetical protein